METKKNQYETTFITNASLDDIQIDAIIAKVQEQIVRYGGEIISVDKWGRKRLSYPIKKKNTGFYTLIEFSAPGNLIQQLEKFYKLDENVIRFLTIQLNKKALTAKIQPVKSHQPDDYQEIPENSNKEPLFEDENENII